MKKLIGLIIAATLLISNGAFAVGIADFVSAGINVVGKVGGAMIDKAMEDSPEEMERKRQKDAVDREAKFNEAIAKIEARQDISPLDKEKLTRQISKTFGMAETFGNLAAQQEMQRRAQRDQMFTAGGMAGVVGNAALSTPSAVMARADLMVKTGVPQAQSRAAIDGANILMKTGQPQAQSRAAVNAATNTMNGGAVPSQGIGDVQLGGTPENKAKVEASLANAMSQHQGEIEKAKADIESAKPKELLTVPEAVNLTSLDKGRKVYVEFAGSKRLTERLQLAFKGSGFEVVGSAAEADSVYQFDGEYNVGAEATREGVSLQAGAFVDSPHPIELTKKGASVKNMVGGFILTMGGRPVPQQQDSGVYRQAVLFVANRRAEGKDIRVSVLNKDVSYEMRPEAMIDGALLDLMDSVGIRELKKI